jgi:hypothetical protein
MNARRMRSLMVVALAVGATLLTTSSATAYNEENVKQIRMERLDAVNCTAPIRILADLTDRSGAAVPGAQVQFAYKKSAAGDSLAPVAVLSNTAGHAETTIQLTCTIGSRIIRASVPGDGSAQLVVTCGPRNGCTGKPQGGVLGIVGLPASDTEVDRISPATVGRDVDDQPFGLVVPLSAAGVLLAIIGVIGWSRRRVRRGA